MHTDTRYHMVLRKTYSVKTKRRTHTTANTMILPAYLDVNVSVCITEKYDTCIQQRREKEEVSYLDGRYHSNCSTSITFSSLKNQS